jgi:hypothetical protein
MGEILLKSKKPLISIHLWTEHMLGTAARAATFLEMIRSLDGGKWVPDKWGQFEPIRQPFLPDSETKIIHDWAEERHGRVSNMMLFTRTNPKLLLSVSSWRSKVPGLNWLWFDMDASEFDGADGVDRLKGIMAEFVRWSGAVYACGWCSGQRHYRSEPGNPLQRLDQLNWLTYFGAPYVEMIGAEHLQACPFYSCETLNGGFLVTAAERPGSPEMVESAETLLRLEECVGRDLFATDDYPEVGCQVPEFDLSETVNPPIVQ